MSWCHKKWSTQCLWFAPARVGRALPLHRETRRKPYSHRARERRQHGLTAYPSGAVQASLRVRSKLPCECGPSFTAIYREQSFSASAIEVLVRAYSNRCCDHIQSFEYTRSEGSNTVGYVRNERLSTLAVNAVCYIHAYNIDSRRACMCMHGVPEA